MSGPEYDVRKSQTPHPAPPGQVGRKTTDTETRTGKTDATRGNERRFRLTMGGFAHRCPSADGFVEGNFEYLLSVAEERNAGGTIQRSVDFRHFQGRLRGEVGDDARLKEIELRGTYTVTRDRPGEAASGSSKEVGPVRFHPYRGGEPDWEAMRRFVESAEDVALGNVILMGGWIYATAELEWTKPNACVELAFEPPTDTRALGAHATADVKIGLRTKGSPPASAGFRADGIQVLREGSVSPKKAEAKQGEQASVAYTAPAKPRRGDGITLAAVSRAGIAEDKWRIIERARYEGTFTQTMSGRTGSGLGGELLPAFEDLADRDRGGAVEHDAEGAALVVVEKEHDCPLEVRVHQARRGDEELPGVQDRFSRLRHRAPAPVRVTADRPPRCGPARLRAARPRPPTCGRRGGRRSG